MEKFEKARRQPTIAKRPKKIFPSPPTEKSQDQESLRGDTTMEKKKERPREEKISGERKNQPLAGK